MLATAQKAVGYKSMQAGCTNLGRKSFSLGDGVHSGPRSPYVLWGAAWNSCPAPPGVGGEQ